MDRFTELETFVAVAETGGFNAAARKLNRSPPSVTRIVASLETRVGTRLFARTTRQIALTEAGQRLLSDGQRILADLGAAEASAAGDHEEPLGTLSVTAPVNFGRIYIAPILQSYLDHYPQVTGRALYLDRIVNLIDEGLDVAVRIGELADSSMTAIRVGDVRAMVVASPEYVAAFGSPQAPADLAAHRIAVSVNFNPRQHWEFAVDGRTISVPVRPALLGNTVDSAVDAALSGWAITRVLSYQVADALREGELVELLPDYEDRRMPVHLLYAGGQLRAAKIRAFVDHAAKNLRRQATGWIAKPRPTPTE